MDNSTTCSTCGSNQLTPLPGKNTFLCRTCGNKGANTPVRHSLGSSDSHSNSFSELRLTVWRKRFYAAYERGDIPEAEQLLDQSPFYLAKSADPCRAYKLMKREDLINTLIKYTVWAVLGLATLKLILYINRKL